MPPDFTNLTLERAVKLMIDYEFQIRHCIATCSLLGHADRLVEESKLFHESLKSLTLEEYQIVNEIGIIFNSVVSYQRTIPEPFDFVEATQKLVDRTRFDTERHWSYLAEFNRKAPNAHSLAAPSTAPRNTAESSLAAANVPQVHDVRRSSRLPEQAQTHANERNSVDIEGNEGEGDAGEDVERGTEGDAPNIGIQGNHNKVNALVQEKCSDTQIKSSQTRNKSFTDKEGKPQATRPNNRRSSKGKGKVPPLARSKKSSVRTFEDSGAVYKPACDRCKQLTIPCVIPAHRGSCGPCKESHAVCMYKLDNKGKSQLAKEMALERKGAKSEGARMKPATSKLSMSSSEGAECTVGAPLSAHTGVAPLTDVSDTAFTPDTTNASSTDATTCEDQEPHSDQKAPEPFTDTSGIAFAPLEASGSSLGASDTTQTPLTASYSRRLIHPAEALPHPSTSGTAPFPLLASSASQVRHARTHYVTPTRSATHSAAESPFIALADVHNMLGSIHLSISKMDNSISARLGQLEARIACLEQAMGIHHNPTGSNLPSTPQPDHSPFDAARGEANPPTPDTEPLQKLLWVAEASSSLDTSSNPMVNHELVDYGYSSPDSSPVLSKRKAVEYTEYSQTKKMCLDGRAGADDCV